MAILSPDSKQKLQEAMEAIDTMIDLSRRAFESLYDLPPGDDDDVTYYVKRAKDFLLYDPFECGPSFLHHCSRCSMHELWPFFSRGAVSCGWSNIKDLDELHEQLVRYVRGPDFPLGLVAALMAVKGFIVRSIHPKGSSTLPKWLTTPGLEMSERIDWTLNALLKAHVYVIDLLSIAWKMDDELPAKRMILEALSKVLPDVTPVTLGARANYLSPGLEGCGSLQFHVDYIERFFRIQRVMAGVLHAIDLADKGGVHLGDLGKAVEEFDRHLAVSDDEKLMRVIYEPPMLLDEEGYCKEVWEAKTSLDPTQGSFLEFLRDFSQKVTECADCSDLEESQVDISVAIQKAKELQATQVPQEAEWLKQLLLAGLGIVPGE